MWLSLTVGHRFAYRVLATALLLSLLVAAGIVLALSAAAQGGGTIVFQTASGGPIFVVDSDGSNLRHLTSGIDPALSPDGQHVAFTRWEGSGHGAFGSLWVINIDGSGERMVLSDVRQPKSPVWSPDGKQIAISTQEGGRLQPESKCGRGLPSEPLLADADGDYFRVAVDIDDDGDVETKLCYTLAPHPHWRLRRVNADTGEFQDLPGDLFSYAPAWDPGNDWHLVYDGEQGLVNLDVTRSEGATWPLTDDPNDHGPVFSPDGSQIAVSYWQHDHWDIHTMRSDGSGRSRLTETPLRVIVEARIKGEDGRAWNNVAPAWSPDGGQIAFLTDRAGRWEIWVMQANGSHQRPLLPAALLDQLGISYNSVNERVLSWE
jgi:dipeptidyl aminopeptidase/acylaminoacyl peptidase